MILGVSRGFVSGALLVLGCAPMEDTVFIERRLQLEVSPAHFREAQSMARVTFSLAEPMPQVVTARYRVLGIEAQDRCQTPDFQAAEGRLTWPPGELEAALEFWLEDDELAELDERLRITLDDFTGAGSVEGQSFELVIEDDDRTAVVDAQAEFGVEPGRAEDQAETLQAALDHAAALGRGVVLVAPGDYEISSVQLAPGTTLSGRGAAWHRPPGSPAETVTLRARHAGASDSVSTLIEGLAIDGRRDEQGAYYEYELASAYLIDLAGDPAESGRLRASVQDVRVSSGTGDGIAIGTNADVDLCLVRASDLWREAVSLHGGNTSLRLRHIDATASLGTSGFWFDGNIPGWNETRTIEVALEDVRLDSGDVEIEASDGSHIELRRLTMTEPPFRLVAPDSTVRIVDSVLQLGVPTDRHNYWGLPHDVEVTRTTLIASERIDEESVSAEQDSSFGFTAIRWSLSFATPVVTEGRRLLFDECHFDLASSFEPADRIYAVANSEEGGQVIVRGSTLGSEVAGWFAPDCVNCTLEP